MDANLLNQYQAAALLRMSPELLRHMVGHQVKWKDKRRLSASKEVDGVYHFEGAELRAYDKWLRAPWPVPSGKSRPGMPEQIRNEIRVEANLECALCKTSGQAGEAAHIEPVHISKNNHPHNLIWLCANHHTKLDNGSFGPKGADNETIVGLKIGLQHFRRAAWLGQAEIGIQIAATLSLCKLMHRQLISAKTSVEVHAFEQLATQTLTLLPQLASQSKVAEVQPLLTQMANDLEAAGGSSAGIEDQLAAAAAYEVEFLEKSGLVSCPLCHGSKTHNGYECPVCSGDGAVAEGMKIDLSDFELIACRLCNGSGRHESESCPACGGEGQFEKRIADRIDFTEFEMVQCPLCEGARRWQGEDCPECGAEGEMPAWAANRVDLSQYDEVKCPLCEGDGRYEGETCPECHGERAMPRRSADMVEVSKYDLQPCPLCGGSGSFLDNDCPPCGGEGKMPAIAVERLDLTPFDLVKCPPCQGTGVLHGDYCPHCAGNKRILRMYAEQL
ncbi:zinc finger domain-containing protein [Variovorax paradoxus]|uniref:zinc finger domain-containing protein n=1 Tax=Variovorax paradoxus TaxID=34073 RepID=UPI002782DE1F|nr:zinc finger domain-containing protein [Variovorax paradoxus]MDQ0589890.1 DnaJ-class molecular chaperone [Variovorax paradoxus]